MIWLKWCDCNCDLVTQPGTLRVCHWSHGPVEIVSFPGKNGDFPYSYVSLPKGPEKNHFRTMKVKLWECIHDSLDSRMNGCGSDGHRGNAYFFQKPRQLQHWKGISQKQLDSCVMSCQVLQDGHRNFEVWDVDEHWRHLKKTSLIMVIRGYTWIHPMF